MARIQVSFKNNDTENKLYQEVIKAYDKSAFIKECIRFYLDNKDMKLFLQQPFSKKSLKKQNHNIVRTVS